RPACLEKYVRVCEQSSARRRAPLRRFRGQALLEGIEPAILEQLPIPDVAQSDFAAEEIEHDYPEPPLDPEDDGFENDSDFSESAVDFLDARLQRELEARRNMELLNNSLLPFNMYRSPDSDGPKTTTTGSSSVDKRRRNIQRTLEGYKGFADGRRIVPEIQQRDFTLPPPQTPTFMQRSPGSADGSFLFEPVNFNEPSTLESDDEQIVFLGGETEAVSMDVDLLEDRPVSPATMLREERLLVRPELGPRRLPPLCDCDEQVRFLAVPNNRIVQPDEKGALYGRPVTLNDRFDVIQPKGILRNPTNFPGRFVNSRKDKLVSLMGDLLFEQHDDMLELEKELSEGNFGVFLEFGTGTADLCNIETLTYNK
ncbi:unnamed protein product, partial [Oikopleura dioica]